MDAKQQKPNIVVQIAGNFKAIDVVVARLEELAKYICNRFGSTNTVVSIAIVGDVEITKLNERFLNRSNTTDCLSFDLSDNQADSSRSFDIIVNGQMAVRQAVLRGHSSEGELALYITHGLLHNLGFDDSTKELAKKMHNMENEILQQHGFGLVYNE